MKTEEEKQKHFDAQLSIILDEYKEKDHVITPMSCYFIDIIKEKLNDFGLTMKDQEINNLNQFLYLINCNYFELIKNKDITNREQLIRKLTNYIILYLKNNNLNIFNDTKLENILIGINFIKQDIKEKILKEYKKSKAYNIIAPVYMIKRKDLKPKRELYKENYDYYTHGRLAWFDINNIENIKSLIEKTYDLEMIKDLKPEEQIKWDFELLKKVFNIMTSYREEFVDEQDDFSNFNLASEFIFVLLSYAIVNKRKLIGIDEILSSFKTCEYIPFNLSLKIINDILEQENLGIEHHPYKIQNKYKNEPKKILYLNRKFGN